MNIGFVGLGTVGQLMAERILAAGHHLVIHDRMLASAENLVARGAVFAETPACVAWEVDIILSMPDNDATAREMILGKDGIVTGLSRQAIHVCCGAISEEQSCFLQEHHAQRGQTYVVATILDEAVAMGKGKLLTFDIRAYDILLRIQPMLECLGTFNVSKDDQLRQVGCLVREFDSTDFA